MTPEEINKIEEEIKLLAADLGIQIEVKANFEEQDDLVNVQIESDQAAALIGFHGETLTSFKLIASFLIRRLLGRWVNLAINVGDYWQKREDQLQKLALSLAMKAKFSQEAQVIPSLSPAERRIVHMALSDNADVYSQSEGEGRERQLVIKPKASL